MFPRWRKKVKFLPPCWWRNWQYRWWGWIHLSNRTNLCWTYPRPRRRSNFPTHHKTARNRLSADNRRPQSCDKGRIWPEHLHFSRRYTRDVCAGQSCKFFRETKLYPCRIPSDRFRPWQDVRTCANLFPRRQKLWNCCRRSRAKFPLSCLWCLRQGQFPFVFRALCCRGHRAQKPRKVHRFWRDRYAGQWQFAAKNFRGEKIFRSSCSPKFQRPRAWLTSRGQWIVRAPSPIPPSYF